MARAESEVERTVRAHAEILTERDYSKIPDVVSESYVEYNPAAPGGEIRGRDGWEEWVREVASAFPDIRAEFLDLVVDGGTAMAEVEFTMTHEGEFAGIEPTGREVSFRVVGKFRVEDGKVSELRDYFDPRELYDQLGVADEGPPGGAAASTAAAENERIAREHFDRVWNRGALDRDAVADDYRVHTNLGARETHTFDEFRTLVETARGAVPDLRKEPVDVFATDERVAIRYVATGTQEGEFKGVPPTGEAFEIEAIAVYRIDDGAIAEEWIVADWLRAMSQLGVVD